MTDKPSCNFSQDLASGAYPQPVKFNLHTHTHTPILIPVSKTQSNNLLSSTWVTTKILPRPSPSVTDTPFVIHTSTSYVGCAPFLIQYICSYLVQSEVASYIHWQSTCHVVVTRDPLNALEWRPSFTNVIRVKCLS